MFLISPAARRTLQPPRGTEFPCTPAPAFSSERQQIRTRQCETDSRLATALDTSYSELSE